MSPDQMAQQLKAALQAVTWPGGNVVFGDAVFVVAGPVASEQIPPGFPFALISIDTGVPDPDHPDLLQQDFTVLVAAEAAGDPMGEHAVIGGSIDSVTGYLDSAGRGVAEVARRARAAVQDLSGADGAHMVVSASGSGPLSRLEGYHVATHEIRCTAVCTSEAHFAPPQNLKLVATTWTWDGAHCSSRFDFVEYVLVRKIGSTPPQTPTDGAPVYTGTSPTFTGTVFSSNVYGVFARYDSRGGGTVEGFNAPGQVGAYLAT